MDCEIKRLNYYYKHAEKTLQYPDREYLDILLIVQSYYNWSKNEFLNHSNRPKILFNRSYWFFIEDQTFIFYSFFRIVKILVVKSKGEKAEFRHKIQKHYSTKNVWNRILNYIGCRKNFNENHHRNFHWCIHKNLDR